MTSFTAEHLARCTLALVDIASESRNEEAIADHVERELRAHDGVLEVRRERHSVYTVNTSERKGRHGRILLVGHLDTVPAQGNFPGRIENDIVHGLGSADMKGSLAVMLGLAPEVAADGSGLRQLVDFVFYDREEVAVTESGLTSILDDYPYLEDVDLAVVLEPTDHTLQFGCLGNINAELVFHGRAAHSARPWKGVNAIHRSLDALASVAAHEHREDHFDGLTYVEVLNVTQIRGGVAQNVIPDELVATVNFRYSPRRVPAEADVVLHEWAAGADEVRILNNSPGAMPCEHNPHIEALTAIGGLSHEPKQAWTDVAQLAARGVDAVNFGPGDPHFAHVPGEQVAVEALLRCHDVLRRLLHGEGRNS